MFLLSRFSKYVISNSDAIFISSPISLSETFCSRSYSRFSSGTPSPLQNIAERVGRRSMHALGAFDAARDIVVNRQGGGDFGRE